MKIVVAGPKGAGKSTVGEKLAETLGVPALCTDTLTEDLFERARGERLTCREIFRDQGEAVFRDFERRAAQETAQRDWSVIVTGGGILMDPDARRALRDNAILVYLTARPEVLWERATANGLPPWLEGPDGEKRFGEQVAHREEVLFPFADIAIDTSESGPEELAAEAAERIGHELAVRCNDANTFGNVIRMTTFGESHGRAVGAILDGVRPGIEIDEEAIQAELDRRRPGQSLMTTQRKESDRVHILSGVFEGTTTGHPICMVIYNEDQKSGHYDALKDLFRPGHADFTYYRKYGVRDHRGGGRSSARETAARVACGAVAKQILAERGVRVVAHTVAIAGIQAASCDYDVIETNPVRCADPEAAQKMEAAVMQARKDTDSVGGVVLLEVAGLPAGLGDPIYAKLDARLTAAIMTIPATKGVEVGGGFALTRLRGSQANDAMTADGFETNHHGGILGGISTGETIQMRVALKPTSSIAKPQQTRNKAGEAVEVRVKGRHDPCIVPRAVPVIEHMAALTILDAWEMQDRLRPGWSETDST